MISANPSTHRRRRRRLVRAAGAGLLGVGLLAATACTEEDEHLFDNVGTTRLLLTSPSLGSQSIKDSESNAQVAIWKVTEATLHFGDQTVDLLLGTKCLFVDTVVIPPQSEQKCGSGIILEAFDYAVPATLDIAFTMQMARAEPVSLPPLDDFDGDRVPNGDDTCPLVANPEQNIDACSFISPINGAFLSDSDADGIPDSIDNCVWVPNNERERPQANTTGVAAFGFDDLIGDACVEQRAEVKLDGSSEIRFVGVPLTYRQPEAAPAFIVVEVDHEEALDCDFDAGACSLNADAVHVCQPSVRPGADPLDPSAGCPR